MGSSKPLMAVMAIFWLMGSSFLLQGISIRLADDDRHDDGDLVSKACSRTFYVDICVSSLRSDPRSSTISDLKGLADLALSISIVHGTETLAYVKHLTSISGGNNTDRHDPAAASYTAKCLLECAEVYDDAVQSLQDSVHLLRIRNFERVNTLVSAAMTDSETCEDGFKEAAEGGSVSPLTQRNQYFFKLCSNFMAITKLLF